jgi:uncharacterized membrane protein YfcA
LEWTFTELLVLAAAVFLGTVVQGTLGFGLALILVPAATLVAPDALPAVVLLLTFPMSVFLAFRERRSVNLSGMWYLIGGRVLGSAGGVALLVLVPAAYLSALFGGTVVAAALASAVSGPKLSVNRRTQTVGGVFSGIMGTAAGIGGPPVALVYQNRSGPEIRGTLAVIFSIGTAISLLSLVPIGRVTGAHLLLTLELSPALLLGLFVAARLAGPFSKTSWLRPAVLIFAAVSGLVAAAQALL